MNIEQFSTIVGIIVGTLGVVAFFQDSFGKLDVIISYEKGNDTYLNKNYIERHTNFVLTITKRGRVKQAIASVEFEVRNLNPSDGHLVDLNEYISVNSLIGISLEQNAIKRLQYDFVSQSAHGFEGLLTRIEVRCIVSDSRNKKFFSPWSSYNDYALTRSRHNKPLSEV